MIKLVKKKIIKEDIKKNSQKCPLTPRITVLSTCVIGVLLACYWQTLNNNNMNTTLHGLNYFINNHLTCVAKMTSLGYNNLPYFFLLKNQ